MVSEGAYARTRWGRFAATDDERLEDLVIALRDPSVDIILCARGGYGLQRIIDRVPPVTKPVLGFSDITALHQAAAIHGCPTLHGIMCKHIAELPEDSEPLNALRNALQDKPLDYVLEPHPLNRPGKACAPVIGGNLSVLYGLQGTPWGLSRIPYPFPILLIEDIGERHYHIDRMMRNLKMSGVLAHLSGLVVGQFTDCENDPLMNGTVYQTIKEAVADYDYPVLFNAPVGHVEHNLPVWFGGDTELTVTTDSFCRLSQHV